MIIPTEPTPGPPSPWPLPKIKLHIEDLDHEGASVFLGAVNPKEALHVAVQASYRRLYTQDNPPPRVTQILLVLRPMPGVAHTFGSGPPDKLEKEIHFSLDYILHCKARARAEIMGVLVHEVVHCYQHNGRNTCPGGLIEGIADYVRLKENLGPPHWRPRGDGTHWDAGYDTTAYFLDWIETQYGVGTVGKLNMCMKSGKYHKRLFKELTACSVKKLWKAYCFSLKGEEGCKIAQDILARDSDSDDSDCSIH